MFRTIVNVLALIGLSVVLLLVGSSALGWFLYDRKTALPETIVLKLDLDQPLVEHVARDPLGAALFGRDASLRTIIDGLDRGRSDPRVKGLVVRFGSDSLGLAQSQELRAAVARFRADGRFALAFAETFGEFGPGNRSYYLATAFDEIWLQPVGLVGLTGLSAQVPFVRGALDKLEVVPQIAQREEYKGAAESLTERGFTPAHREMMGNLLDDLSGQLVEGIAASRKLDAEAVRSLIDRGPFLDREALDARLIDRLGYYDAAIDQARERAGAGAKTKDLFKYLGAAGHPHDKGPTVAVVYAVGGIQRGDGGVNPLLGGTAIGSTEMVKAFDEAARAPDVRAIVLRIDSGGGSAVASESIRRAVVRAREAGKPVIVSMGDAAASGGYWIAMNADRIIAEPATLTGSIGVFAGKMVTGRLWDQLGITWETVDRGRHAAMWSSSKTYSESEMKRVDAMLDDIYAAFVRHVAEARKLPLERVRDIAKGRVWTGRQALGLGLVDELGDMELALRRAREATGLAADAGISLTVYPRPDTPWERLMDMALGGGSGHVDGALAAALRPVAALLRPTAGPELRMPVVGTIE